MSREGWPQNMPCNLKTLQKAARALQPSWCLQGYKPLFCLIAQGHVHSSDTSTCVYNQARRSHPCRWLCSAFLSFEPFFHPWRSAVNLFCSPGSQGMSATAKAQGMAGTLGTERAPHPWAPSYIELTLPELSDPKYALEFPRAGTEKAFPRGTVCSCSCPSDVLWSLCPHQHAPNQQNGTEVAHSSESVNLWERQTQLLSSAKGVPALGSPHTAPSWLCEGLPMAALWGTHTWFVLSHCARP